MKTVSIEHRSRSNIHRFTWESDDASGGSFTAQDDGEIYDASVRTNLSSFTIDGANVTLPFAVSRGVRYLVAPIKINNSLAASLIIKGRRATDKYFDINVTSFVAYDGRYLYVLLANNTIEKCDSVLMTPANWSAGSWIVSPKVGIINLPVLPDSTIYQTITFVKNGGIPKLFIQGITLNSLKVYASFVMCSDDTVWNLALTTQNDYTQIINSTSIYNSSFCKCATYDYVSDSVIVTTSSGIQGQCSYVINLNTLGVSIYTYGSNVEVLLRNGGVNFLTKHRPIAIIPTENKLANCLTLFDNGGYTYCYFVGNNQTTTQQNNACYNKIANRIITMAENTIGKFREYTINGQLFAYYNINAGIISGQNPIVGFSSHNNQVLLLAQSVTNNNFSYYDKATSYGKGFVLSNPASGSTYLINLMKTYFNDLWFCTGNNSGAGLRRLHVIKTSEAIPDFGYLDFSADILDMHTTQIWD